MKFATDAMAEGCALRPTSKPIRPGHCIWCDATLPPRRRYCSDECRGAVLQHFWGTARPLAINRDHDRCTRCRAGDWERRLLDLIRGYRLAPTPPSVIDGSPWGTRDPVGGDTWRHEPHHTQPVMLEVNHIEPRNGQGYGPGCHHHLENLETLCRSCHVATTTEQRRARTRARRATSPQGELRLLADSAGNT